MRSFIFLLAICTCSYQNISAQFTLDSLNALYISAWKFGGVPRPLDKEWIEGDPRLYDMSMEAISFREKYWKDVQQQLRKVDAGSLKGQDKINYEVFRYIVDDNVASYTYKTYLIPFNAEGGFHTEFGFLPASSPFESEKDYKNYLVKLNDFPESVDQHIALLQQAIDKGYVLPCVILQGFEKTAEAYLSNTVEENLFYAPFMHIPQSVLNAAEIKKRGEEAVSEKVLPAYRRLAAFLKDKYVPACSEAVGTTTLPDGKAYYKQRINYFTTLDMTAEEIFALGQAEVNRIRSEMEVIIDSLGFKGTFADFLHFLRTDPQFYAKTPHQLLAEASYFSKRIDGKLPDYFGKLPWLPYGVEPVPAQIAPRYTGGRYSPGSYENHKAGNYWVNTFKLESRPLYVLPSLTLHEAVPGHHFQISLAAENEMNRKDPLPDFRNEYYISTYGEGWALYCEWLGKEMGIYEDLYQKFGALTYEMWRACRLVVDPGLHAMNWTREEAVKFMAENTALSLHEVNTEIDRYIGWPGQAVSYKIGELKIRELRKEAESKLGAKFDLKAFHDKVLENGSVPLFVLERVINEWVDECKKKEG